jgi:hypothetical protein
MNSLFTAIDPSGMSPIHAPYPPSEDEKAVSAVDFLKAATSSPRTAGEPD